MAVVPFETLLNEVRGLIADGKRSQAVARIEPMLAHEVNRSVPGVSLLYFITMDGTPDAERAAMFTRWAKQMGGRPAEAARQFIAKALPPPPYTPGSIEEHALMGLANGLLVTGHAEQAIEARTLATWPAVSVTAEKRLDDIAQRYAGQAPIYDRSEIILATARVALFIAFFNAAVAGRFARGLDLCCGTGLMGPTIRRVVDRLVGVDLSPEMLAQAPPGLYDALVTREAMAYLAETVETFDLAVLSNVMPYFGDPAALFARLAARMVPGGKLVVVVDVCTDAHELRSTGFGVAYGQTDYCHSRRFIETAAKGAGLVPAPPAIAEYRRGLPGAYYVLTRA